MNKNVKEIEKRLRAGEKLMFHQSFYGHRGANGYKKV